jgi:purine-binding chemotaxis protein CheW
MSTIVEQLSPQAQQAPALEYLAFTVGGEEYGIDIQTVQELRGYAAVTRIANAPAHMKGVVNLRGIIVPIVDLRIKLGCSDPVYDQFTVVVILNLSAGTIGIVVDRVSDVTTLTQDQIKPPPAMGAGIDIAYVTGLGALDGQMLILVDIDSMLAASDHILIERLAA